MRKRISELFGILAAAACILGLVLVVAPMANATPLDDQNATIVGDRFKYGKNCPPLKLNPTLESMAQDVVFQYIGGGSGPVASFPSELGAPDASRYIGDIRSFKGTGDPQSQALTRAYEAGAGGMLSNCEFTEFGSGFYRDPNAGSENDAVMIIFGKPSAPAQPAAPDAPVNKPAAPVDAPAATPPTTCPAGSKLATVEPGTMRGADECHHDEYH